MRTSSLLLQLALATTAAAQIAPPSWGVVEHAGNRAVEVQGLPGSWLAVPAPSPHPQVKSVGPATERSTSATVRPALPGPSPRLPGPHASPSTRRARWPRSGSPRPANSIPPPRAGRRSSPSRLLRPNCWTCRTRARAPSNSCCALPAPGVARRRNRPRIALAQESRSRRAPPPSPT